jgi:hypothetical protein
MGRRERWRQNADENIAEASAVWTELREVN